MRMESMTARVALLSILAILAASMVGVVHASGTDITQPISMKVAVRNYDGQYVLEVIQDSKVVQSIPLEEGSQNVTIDMPNGQKVQVNIVREDDKLTVMMMGGNEVGGTTITTTGQDSQDKALEIAKADPRVQELINGNDYQLLGAREMQGPDEHAVILTIAVRGQAYDITVDMNAKAVTSIEPATGEMP